MCIGFRRPAVVAAAAFLFWMGPSRVPAQNAPAKPAAAPPAFQPTPEMLAIQAASNKEHEREMQVLGITQLRPAASGDMHSPNAANYDEAKADIYTNTPNPLVLADGKPVTTAAAWWRVRRPQLVALFNKDIYGYVPADVPAVKWEVKSVTHAMNGDVPVITKTLVGHVDNAGDPAITVDIDLTLSTPADAKGPVPVVMELGFSKAFMAMLMKRFPQFAAMAGTGPTWQQQVLAHGWGYAEYVPTSAQPDNGAGLFQGIIGLANKGKPRTMDQWGVLRAWAWGASRCLDYFATDKDVNAKEVGLEGHSRYGKAALVAMAYDPRFAVGYISSSGEGGAKLYRHHFGEQVSNLASDEFYWMAGNFMRYAGPLNTGDLPVDANELIAMVAPRPVFISGGATNGDGWVDAKGMFLAASGASPVYRLLGERGLGTTVFPPMGSPLLQGALAFRQHFEGHTPAPNWPYFIELAERYLRAPGYPDVAAGEPVHLTAEQDRERMLGLLGIKDSEMRPQASTDANSPNAANFDEAKADVYPTLPKALVLNDGQPVTTPEQWWKERRPQIMADFDHDILGCTPGDLPRVTWAVVKTTPEHADGMDVVVRRVVGTVDDSIDPNIPVHIGLLLVTPAHAAGPVPVIMQLALAAEFQTALAGPVAGAPDKWGVPWQPVLRRGWAFAMLSPTSYQADNGAGLTEGIIGLMNHGQPRAPEDWGVLKAWAWGASRALDYLETNKAVNAKEVGLEGHSRMGKAALVAMAYDPRFAIVYSSSSGEGGAKLYRHIFGEPLTSVTGVNLYHWFDGEFLRYGGPKNAGDLPVDAHELIALCAPRPVFIGGGADVGDGYVNPNGDAWADSKGMFLAEVAAGPVYRILGAKGLGTTVYRPVETTLITGDLGFRQQPYGHTPQPNWPYFLEFASHYFHSATGE